MATDDPLRRLEEKLGYAFRDRDRLRDAMTHRSFVNERPELAPEDNERMEFLGDALLDLAASALLWREYPGAREGELTRRRADLVCEASLASIARELDLGSALRLGKGEEKSGGRDKPRLLASALEALIAAVYLDADEKEAIAIGRSLLAPYVDVLAPGALDFKSRLQERMQAHGQPPPTYELRRTDGPDHDRTFHVDVVVTRGGESEVVGAGSGRSKLLAEQIGARAALEALGELPD